MKNNENRLALRRLTLRQGYLIALGIIFLVATFKFVAMELLVVQQDDAAIVINISGRQRMLSQRAAFFAQEFMYSQTEQERNAVRSNIQTTIDEFEGNHQDLIEGNSIRNLPILTNKDFYDVYYNQSPALDDLVKEYVRSVRIILNSQGQGSDAHMALDYINQIGPYVLLNKLDDVVKLHEKKAKKDVQFILNLQKVFWFLTILVLSLEGLYLFRPMIRRIEGNIDELKKTERKIKSQLEELERFTTIASHDLQEPLRKVIGFTERLEKHLQGKLDDKAQTYMNFISLGANHMRELVRGLHKYSKILAAEDNLEKVDANKALKLALKNLDENIRNINAEISHDDLPEITYNKEMLVQVFEELIENAIKYRGDDALFVSVGASEERENWKFCIADNGIGVNEKFFERIFSMFQRLHRKEDIPGVGIGLTLAAKIIERHGGEISVKSIEGQGTQFYFTVPKKV